MGCRVETDPERGLVVVRAEGEIGVQDIFAAISQVWREPAYCERACVLWDLRRAGVESLHSGEVREIVGLERGARPDSRRARMAMVVGSEVGYGLARMVEALVTGEPIDVHVFRHDEEAAWAWLTGSEAPSRGVG